MSEINQDTTRALLAELKQCLLVMNAAMIVHPGSRQQIESRWRRSKALLAAVELELSTANWVEMNAGGSTNTPGPAELQRHQVGGLAL